MWGVGTRKSASTFLPFFGPKAKKNLRFPNLLSFCAQKSAGVESAAQLFLQQLATSPCCSCLPPAQLEGSSALWEGHLRQELEQVFYWAPVCWDGKMHIWLGVARYPGTLPATAGCQVMKTQLDVLRSRDSSSIARGLTWPSHGLGLPIALQAWRESFPWLLGWYGNFCSSTCKGANGA